MDYRVPSSRRSGAAWLILFATAFATAALLTAPALLAGPAGPATPAAKAAPLVVPVSILDLMRASVEIPADGIWAAQGADKLDDDDWLLVDEDSVSLVGAATLISKPGTGKNDRKWVANADWQSWVREVQTTALAIRAAAKAKDSAKFTAAADHLSEVCQSCHTKYRPQAPSDGVARYPFYPKRELAK
jgi:Cytochrome C'